MSNLSDFLPPPSDTWGPAKIEHTYTFVPVEFVGRTEKLGRFCDFTVSSMRARRPDQPEEFQFVDSRPIAGRARKYAPRAATQYQQGGRGKGKGAPYGRGRGQWGAVRIDHRTGKPVPVRSTGQKQQQPHWQRGPSNIVKGIREWSVPIKPEYTLLGEINLGAIGRKRGAGVSKFDWLITDASKIEHEDLIKCGQLAGYDKTYDKVSARKPVGVQKFDDVNFYNVSTSQDPVMEELITRAAESEDLSSASDKKSSLLIACTDQVLSVLMAANRSIYSWDLVITRNGNTILIDKRDGATCIDFQTVNENAQDPPSYDENLDPLQQINSPVKLGVEATAVSQNISQMVLSLEDVEDMEYPNPFFDEDEEENGSSRPACTSYIYRKTFIPAAASSIGRDLNFILRGEVNAKGGVAVKTLTEYDSKLTNWKDSFERNRDTAVFATEMKNNSCKISRWLASCVVGDCDMLKVGFVVRKTEEDPWNHQLLAVQSHSVSDLMSQMAMSQQSMWSSVLSLIEQIVGIEEETVGRYLVVKDPSKPVLNLYAIPWDEFEDAEDREGDDEEDNEEDVDDQEFQE